MRLLRLALAGLLSVLALASPPSAHAQERRVRIHYHPTIRAQIAIWIESADGTRFRTVRLTERTALFGIGNRPGALQMNSAFRWPYGRREGVLPVWAHRRYEANGMLFPRVVFAGRESEGNASSAGSFGEIANTRDESYCLSFTLGDESLDAVSCATVFMSNKGRYLTEADVAAGYSEPWEDPGGTSRMRALAVGSLYPPRRDAAIRCTTGCPDHADVRRYAADTLAVMPEIDAVSMPTPGDAPTFVEIEIPEDWPDGDYRAFLEINTEGDYAPGWDAMRYPTPRMPSGTWDSWAISYGYPYRGQPSVVYEVPFEVHPTGGEFRAVEPIGYGDLHGRTGDIAEMDATIQMDHQSMPGSGGDRLQPDPAHGGARLRVVVPPTDVCLLPDPPSDCGRECGPENPCTIPTVCGPEGECVDRCAVQRPPLVITPELSAYPDRQRTHEWARLRFTVPESASGILQYSVRVSTEAIDPEDRAAFEEIREAKIASAEDVRLEIDLLVMPDGSDCPPPDPEDPDVRLRCVPRPAGSVVEVDIGHLERETRHWVGVSAQDECGDWGGIGVAEIETTAIEFTTVSPCFVATAAYGSPLDARIDVLRRFRDRHLRSNAVGRAVVSAYETVGPIAAAWIAEDEDRRAAARAVLDPIVSLME